MSEFQVDRSCLKKSKIIQPLTVHHRGRRDSNIYPHSTSSFTAYLRHSLTNDTRAYSGERELIGPTSSRKTGHQAGDGVAVPQSKL